jgi:nucleoside-diphosphate-sugar epimerase
VGVLITGAAGAIGSYLLGRFRADRGECAGLDIVDQPGIDRCDVTDRDGLARAVERHCPDLVVHCAGQMDVAGKKDPLELVRANILSLANVCSVLKGSETRLIFMSSRGVYPWLRADRVPVEFTEQTPLSVGVERSIYDLSKLTIEGIAERYRLQYGLHAVGLRLSSTFGPGKSEETHGHQSLLNRMFDAARLGRHLRIAGADQESDFVYYGDIYQACIRVAALPGMSPSPVYNVGTGPAPLAEYAAALRELFPAAPLEVEGGLDYLGTGGFGYVNLSYRRAARELGYAPAYTPALAFAEMANLVAPTRQSPPWTVRFAPPARLAALDRHHA